MQVRLVRVLGCASVAVCCVLAFGLIGRVVPIDRLGMKMDLGVSFASQVLLMMLPLVMLLACLQTLVSALAKSYREAQTYQSILMLVPIFPSVLLSVTPMKVADWMYYVPLLGQQIGIMHLLRGEPLGAMQIVHCVLMGVAVAVLAMAATAWVYRSERLAISA